MKTEQGRWLCKLVLFFCITSLLGWAQLVLAAEASLAKTDLDREALSHTTITEPSDEQVRQLLIAELQKKSEPESTAQQAIGGPGKFLENILSTFQSNAENSDNQTASLLSKLPNVIPDLKKVFLTL